MTKIQKEFGKDPRKQQDIEMQPVWEEIFGNVFFGLEKVEWNTDDIILDRDRSVDFTLRFKNGMPLYGQVKSLSYKQRGFGSLTLEYHNNWPNVGDEGDWFKCGAQVYACGYCAEDKKSLDPWIIVNWMRVVRLTQSGHIYWLDNSNIIRGRADFKYTFINRLPHDCIVAKGNSSGIKYINKMGEL